MASIGGLLDTSRQALNAQTQSIRVIGDNIANVNTEGYTRRRGDLVTGKAAGATGVEVGTGVIFDRSVRIADKFLDDELVARMSDRSYSQIRDEILSRAQTPFALDGATGRIGFQFNEFFGAFEDLQVNPADIPLRTQVIQKGNDLVISIRETFNQLASLQREADDRLGILVEDVNRLSNSIAELNFEITKADTPNQEALTLRDQRNELVRQLGELVSFESVENTDGTLLIYLANGFSLVNGATSRDLDITGSPSFQQAAPNNFPPGLDGNPLRHIVFSFSPTSQQDLTRVLASGDGEIGGLLSLRGVQPNPTGVQTNTFDTSGDLVDFASHIEYMTRDLLTRFNETYNGPDRDGNAANFLQPSGADLDGNPTDTVGDFASIYSLFAFEGIENVAVLDGGNNRPQEVDIDNIINAEATISSFSRILTFNISDERELAAARDQNIIFPDDGIQSAPGDASNIEALLIQRDTAHSYNELGLNRTGTRILFQQTKLEDLYGLTVSSVGGVSARARDDLVIFEQREAQVRELQQSVSGVNLDEEFAKLINFQRGFEAAARMIRVGDELFQQIIGLLG